MLIITACIICAVQLTGFYSLAGVYLADRLIKAGYCGADLLEWHGYDGSAL